MRMRWRHWGQPKAPAGCTMLRLCMARGKGGWGSSGWSRHVGAPVLCWLPQPCIIARVSSTIAQVQRVHMSMRKEAKAFR